MQCQMELYVLTSYTPSSDAQVLDIANISSLHTNQLHY